MSADELTNISGLPGQWQYWCDAQESGACWVIPADDEAQQTMRFSSSFPRDFMKVSKASLRNAIGDQEPPPLF